ncbi:hypothetical protein NDU88_001658, partial [Pleurodeles waltl]
RHCSEPATTLQQRSNFKRTLSSRLKCENSHSAPDAPGPSSGEPTLQRGLPGDSND